MNQGLAVTLCVATIALMMAGVGGAPAIGIDLGTSFSVVGVWRDGSVEIIPNAQGSRTTPSWVAFTPRGRLVGESARNQAVSNPEGTLYDAKRLIGRLHGDASVQKDIENFPFAVASDEAGRPVFEVPSVGSSGGARVVAPVEVSAMVLAEMKASAEAYLGESVTQAVVTVPAYFDDTQRAATKDAAGLAGLEVLRMINEPTAAALAYGLDRKGAGTKTVLVYDLGGGTFDVTLLEISGGDVKVQATAGDTHLGGDDLDHLLMDWVVDRYAMKHGSKADSLRSSVKAMARVKAACEEAKRTLSSAKSTRIELENLMGVDYSETITRSRFELLVKDVLRRTVKPIMRVLEDADIYVGEVDEVVLVGGSTRIPYIRKMLETVFKDPKKINTNLNPDEAVAYGAAIQAAMLTRKDASLRRMSLTDVSSLSVGIRTALGTMNVLIPRNTPIPVSRSKVFSTSKDNQAFVRVAVFEGERTLAKDNIKLGSFTLRDLPPGPRGSVKVKVTFTIDADGLLSVEGYVVGRGSIVGSISIDAANRMDDEDVERMLHNLGSWEAEEALIRESVQARGLLHSYAVRLSAFLSGIQEKPEEAEEDGNQEAAEEEAAPEEPPEEPITEDDVVLNDPALLEDREALMARIDEVVALVETADPLDHDWAALHEDLLAMATPWVDAYRVYAQDYVASFAFDVDDHDEL